MIPRTPHRNYSIIVESSHGRFYAVASRLGCVVFYTSAYETEEEAIAAAKREIDWRWKVYQANKGKKHYQPGKRMY
jgi:hypothetical protein